MKGKGRNGMSTIQATRIGLAGWLLCAAAWADPAPSGPMTDYEAHCTWGRLSSKAACAHLADRLGKVEWPSREERLALVWSRNELRGTDSLGRAEACSATEAIVAEHPDYADALFHLSRCAVMGLRQAGADDEVALLLRAAESEPDNYLVLRHLTGRWIDTTGIDSGTLAAYRESLYAAARARVDWQRAVLPEEAVVAQPDLVWSELYDAARRIYAAALGEGDLDAAEAVQVRFRRDAGLDALDHGAGAPVVLALACRHPIHIGLEDICVAAVERLAGRASADGLPLPPVVLEWVERATGHLRHEACAASTGQSGVLILPPGVCEGPEGRRPTRWPGCGQCWRTTAARGRRNTTASMRRGSSAGPGVGTACARHCGRTRRTGGRGATWRGRCRGSIPKPPPTSWAKGETRRAWNPASSGGTGAHRPCRVERGKVWTIARVRLGKTRTSRSLQAAGRVIQVGSGFVRSGFVDTRDLRPTRP